MKNIFLLPTDQLTSVLYGKDDKYKLANSTMSMDWFISSAGYKPKHIYITSDEEIKEGVNQWYLDKFLNKPMNSGGAQYGEKQNVIILTTDSTLIADGVQSIDDEFLKWFVKNPSCEFVEVNKKLVEFPLTFKMMYKIIIPQEEPKQVKYTEDEVRELLIKGLTHNDDKLCGSLVTVQKEIRTANFNVWFEENKKK
jgi:hypothetical protein